MSGDRPKLISMPTSFSQGVARADMKTWGVLSILLAIAVVVVVLFNLTYEKKPMFGDAPFGTAPPPPRQERVIPVAPPGSIPVPPPGTGYTGASTGYVVKEQPQSDQSEHSPSH